MRLILLVLLFVAGCRAYGAPVFIAHGDEGKSITLTDEPCTIPVVKNLPLRAVWTQRGSTFEGCWGTHFGGRLVVMYWDDLTVVTEPTGSFARVRMM